jgi:hypothetical protein
MGNFVSSLKVYFSRIPVEFKDATPCPDGNEAIPRSTPEREKLVVFESLDVVW